MKKDKVSLQACRRLFYLFFCLSALVVLSQGCQSNFSPQQSDSFETATTGGSAQKTCAGVGRTTLHRLNNLEYSNSINALFGSQLSVATNFDEDQIGETFNNTADALSLSHKQLVKYFAAAKSTVDQIVQTQRSSIFTCSEQTDTCASTIISKLATAAYRRDLNSDELNELMTVYRSGKVDGFDKGVQLAVQAILVAPQFLYRNIDLSEPTNRNFQKSLSASELASRLAYFLWSAPPDAILMSKVQDGSILQTTVLLQQVDRMLLDARSKALITSFATQLFQLNRIGENTPNATAFPQFNESIRQGLLKESQSFLQYIFANNLSLSEIVTANYTFLDENLANYYGIPGVTGTEFRKVIYPNSERQGLITHGSVLLLTSHSDQPSIIYRGKWVLQSLLCDTPPPPPDNIMQPPASSELDRSLGRLQNPACVFCHSRMDPIGTGLQNFNAIGLWRTKDELQRPIDGTGTLSPGGQVFHNVGELNQTISEDPRLKICFAKKMLSYALGRDLIATEKCQAESVAQLASTTGRRFTLSDLIKAVVTSPSFLNQRGEGDDE